MKTVLLMIVALLLAGCSAGPTTREALNTYDFGPVRADTAVAKTIRASVLLHGVSAPAWLDSPAVVYRLAYQDAARQYVYANSRWATQPGALIGQRLRGRLAAASEGGVIVGADGARADYSLRVDLEMFSQIFDAADRSRGVVVARASLVNTAKRTLVAQRSFTIEKPAASADAEGGVRALAAAGDELVDSIVAWTAAGIAQGAK
jgi:cholesterol transport system auxiliary component